MNLSERLLKIANMVIPGEPAADIGTDHGLLPAYLLEKGKCQKVVLSDLNQGPLDKAKQNFIRLGIAGGDFRLGSGIAVLDKKEVSSIVIAGMGGELIESIISDDLDKAKSFKKLILQPRTRSDELRCHLKDLGFEINDYALAKEKGRICEIYSIVPKDVPCEENHLISDFLLKTQDPLLKEFIENKIYQKQILIESISHSAEDKTDAIVSLKEDIRILQELLLKNSIQ